jgi:hypothetical protein
VLGRRPRDCYKHPPAAPRPPPSPPTWPVCLLSWAQPKSGAWSPDGLDSRKQPVQGRKGLGPPELQMLAAGRSPEYQGPLLGLGCVSRSCPWSCPPLVPFVSIGVRTGLESGGTDPGGAWGGRTLGEHNWQGSSVLPVPLRHKLLSEQWHLAGVTYNYLNGAGGRCRCRRPKAAPLCHMPSRGGTDAPGSSHPLARKPS